MGKLVEPVIVGVSVGLSVKFTIINKQTMKEETQKKLDQIIDRELFHVLSVHLSSDQRNAIMEKIDRAIEAAYQEGHHDGWKELENQLPNGSIVM